MILDHGIVHADPAYYCGWPANHGAWQWNDELLVGFLRGAYRRKSMHNIAEPFTKLLARSLDGGETWEVKTPNVDFNCLSGESLGMPAVDLNRDIIRICGVYDHGGDDCDERGGFYLSRDRGHTWGRPHAFAGLEAQFPGDGRIINTSRTCTLDQLVFLSRGQAQMWGTDETFCAAHDGDRFRFVGTVCADDARAVMPAAARLPDGEIVVALRRRKTGRRDGWIDAFGSDDEGATWRHLAYVGGTGGRNGNPPALLALPDGRLICCYGNRDQGEMVYAISEDQGATWYSDALRASESATDVDIGYPRLFLRNDEAVVCVYYWVSAERPQQHIARTIFRP